MDYKKFLSANGLTNNDMIALLQKRFPKYSKATQSMVTNPEKYGVRLTADAEAALKKMFYKPPKTEKKRAKANRISARLDDETYKRLNELMDEYGCETVQQAVERLINGGGK